MNEYFQTGAVPAPSSPGASSVMRQEFANIAAGFDKLPVLAGHAGEIVFVDATGSRLETNGTVMTDFATLAGVQILTNKTLAWADNTFTGFNDAATKVAGTGAGEVLLLAEANKLPVLDGSLLTNLNQDSLSTVSIAKGGTGATDLTSAQANLGIDLKADANNAVLTGAPTAPTPLTGDASARIATTYFVADTMQAIGAFGPSSANPLMNGVVSPGVAILGSRSDHVHPSDTSRAPVASPTFTGVPAAPTAAADTNTTQLASTAFVVGQAGLSSPLMDGVAAVGTSVKFARDDHRHPTDTSLAPIDSPTFTGDPKAPTPLTTDNDTSIATTAFVQSLLAQQPPAGMQPSNSTPLMDGTAAAGTGVEGSRYDHVHPSDTSRVSKAGDNMTGMLNALVGLSIKNIATGINDGNLVAGEFVPTFSDYYNIAAMGQNEGPWRYIRMGKLVFVWGGFDVNHTAINTATSFQMSPPFPKNFTALAQLHGVAVFMRQTGNEAHVSPGYIYPISANDKLGVNWYPTETSGQAYRAFAAYSYQLD